MASRSGRSSAPLVIDALEHVQLAETIPADQSDNHLVGPDEAVRRETADGRDDATRRRLGEDPLDRGKLPHPRDRLGVRDAERGPTGVSDRGEGRRAVGRIGVGDLHLDRRWPFDEGVRPEVGVRDPAAVRAPAETCRSRSAGTRQVVAAGRRGPSPAARRSRDGSRRASRRRRPGRRPSPARGRGPRGSRTRSSSGPRPGPGFRLAGSRRRGARSRGRPGRGGRARRRRSRASRKIRAPYAAIGSSRRSDASSPTRTTQRTPARAAYAAAASAVLPAEATNTVPMPSARALVSATLIARSFCEPDGLTASFFHHVSAPTSSRARISGVSPSPSVTGSTPAATGRRSRYRQIERSLSSNLTSARS